MAPRTNNGQPSDASNGQPATDTGQSVANTGQPSVTNAEQPSGTNNGQPAPSAGQPSATNNGQPAIANTGQPATTTAQPPVIVNGLPPHRQRNQQRQRQQQRQLQPSPQLTYPTNKSPIVPGSAQLDADWIAASRAYDVFNMALPAVNTPGYMETWSAKCNHMQANFWAALDRANRASRPPRGDRGDPEARRCWHYHDMRAMVTWFRRCFGKPQPEDDPAAHADGIWRDVLLSSPWFDCPDFMDLLWEVARDRNGNMVLNHLGQGMVVERDPRKAELEEQFLDRWWFRVARLPVRRWPTGDVVMPLNAGDFFRIYGPWASLWPHVRDPDLLYID